MNAFEAANPKVFARACIDPDAMEKLTDMEKRVDDEKSEYNRAAFDTKQYRIASETLAIVEERMVINQSPRPPSWADNGRGGTYDPRTIYEQAHSRINLKDEAYNIQIEQYRNDARERLANEATTNQQERHMSEQNTSKDQLISELYALLDKSHQTRTDLNVWYHENKDALVAQAVEQGSDAPIQTAMQEQRGRVDALHQETKDMMEIKVNSFFQSQDQELNGHQPDQIASDKRIPEPPSMNPERDDMPEIGHDLLNGSEMEH